MLTLHQLEVFVTVARLMSVRAAADELTVSQPAVSASLAALQREVGVELVGKAGRNIELTDAGEVFAQYSRRVLTLLDEALHATRADDLDQPAPVRLGATSSVAAHLITPLLARLRDEHPSLDFGLEISNQASIWRMLAEHHVDVVITNRPPSTAAFTSLATRANEFVIVARPGLVWMDRLDDATWLIREEGSTTRAATEEVMARLDLTPDHLVIGANAAVIQSAEAGLGVAVLPAAAVADAVRDRRLIIIRSVATPLPRPWHVVVRSNDEPPASVGRFVADLVALDEDFSLTSAGEGLLATVAGA